MKKIIISIILVLVLYGVTYPKIALLADNHTKKSTNIEYLLLVRNKTWLRKGDFPVYTYSFIGKNIANFKEGMKIYDSLNNIYSFNTDNFDIKTYMEYDNRNSNYGDSIYAQLHYDDYMNYYNMRKVVTVSKDGKLVVSSSFPKRDENTWSNSLPLDTWINQYDIFENNTLVYTFFDNDTGNYLTNAYFISNDFVNEEQVDTLMGCSLVSPDNKYLAFAGPQLGDDDKGKEGIQDGYFIKDLENEEVFYYPANASNYEIICWVEKDRIMGK